MDERPDGRALEPDTPPEPAPPEVPADEAPADETSAPTRRWPSIAEEIRAAAREAEREQDRSG